MKKQIFAAIVLAALSQVAMSASVGFSCITSNDSTGDPTNCEIGEVQLAAEVTDLGNSQVQFHFTNAVGYASSITDVYFDDGTLLGIASVSGSSGVSFTQLANPGELPGASGAEPDFETTAGFSADSDPPAEHNGVNASDEWLNVVFNLQSGGTFADVLGELESGALRIGLHVQGFADGGSESFVNVPYLPPGGNVPLPGAVWLFGSALVGLVTLSRRRRVA